MIIGVTGQIGAGKSTAARFLAEAGARIVDADQIGHLVVDRSMPLKRKLARSFGSDVLTPTGRVRRKRLAARAFVDDASKKRLNRIVHPYLLQELRKQAKATVRVDEVVIIDAALLLDWNLDREIDQTLVIHAGWPLRLARLLARGMAPADALARQRAQLPYAEYRRRASRLILNNGRPEDLRRKVLTWFRRLA